MTDTPPTILCATDLDRSGDDAARLATAYAKHVGGRLHLVHAVEDAVPFEALDPHVRAAAEALEERLRARHQAAEEKLDALFGLVRENLPERLWETAYALACDIAAADGTIRETELRLLEEMRYELSVDRLHAAAIEWGARVRHMQP